MVVSEKNSCETYDLWKSDGNLKALPMKGLKAGWWVHMQERVLVITYHSVLAVECGCQHGHGNAKHGRGADQGTDGVHAFSSLSVTKPICPCSHCLPSLLSGWWCVLYVACCLHN